MATITLYASKINQMSGLIKAAKNSVETFKSELSDLQKKANKVDSGVCDLSEVISSIQASAQTQENRIESLDNFQTKSEDFINDTVSIDNKVAETVNQNKEDFYEKYDYLKPDCEKNFLDRLKDLGEWCKEHWKVIVGVIVIAALGIASVLTCGAVAALLSAAFIGALKGALAGAVLSGLSSLVEGGSFWEGAENGFFSGALLGGFFGGLGKGAQLLGSSCKFLMESGAGQFLVEHFSSIVKLAKFSRNVSLTMFGFDLLSLGAGLAFGKDNWLTSLNRKLHQSTAYNIFQFTASTLAVVAGGLVKGMRNATCFVAGTMVLTASGLVAIERIKIGDMVISTNPIAKESGEKRVVQTYVNNASSVVHITACGEEIVSTLGHKFYVPVLGWISACEICAGMTLVLADGSATEVESVEIEKLEHPVKVYNFEVQDWHTYHVGTLGILVHNLDCYWDENVKKIHGDLPSESELEKLNSKQLKKLASQLEESINTREMENARLGDSNGALDGHEIRIEKEYDVLDIIFEILEERGD